MGSRQGGKNVSIENLKEVLGYLDEIEDEYLQPTRKALRRYTKIVGATVVIPALKESAAKSGVPIAPAMADTARVIGDIVIRVKVGAVNPKLSGFRRGVGIKKSTQLATRKGGHSKSSQSYRTTLAFGSERGPYDAQDRRYGVPQAPPGGYWVDRLYKPDYGLAEDIRDRYVEYLQKALLKYGKYR